MLGKIGKLAYEFTQGAENWPVLVFLPGYKSDMTGSKAQYLSGEARVRGQPCLLLDYSGHGNSEGRFEDGTIGQWTNDALDVIDNVTNGPVMIVGSSMGGWIGLHVALRRPERVKGFVGIAAAPDFTADIKTSLTPEQRGELNNAGFLTAPSEYGDGLIFTKKLLDEGDEQLLLQHPIPLEIPVMLIHGKLDRDVPWDTAERIAAALSGTRAEIVYVEDGEHRLSRPEDLGLIGGYVAAMARNLYLSDG